MFEKAKKITAILIGTVIIFTSCFTSFAEENSAPVESDTSSDSKIMTGEEALDYLNQAIGIIMTKYKFDVSEGELYKAAAAYVLGNHPELLEDFFKGAYDSLDDYSTYFTQEQLDAFLNRMSDEFCGIGVIVTTVENGLLVTKVYDDTPALEGGIMADDVITKVGDISLAGMDISTAQSYITGQENTPVTITVQRRDNTFTATMMRRKVVIDSGVYASLENDTIGYIKIDEFGEKVDQFTKKALESFDEKGIKDVIIDLRNNPGGSLSAMVRMCSIFIPAGPAIHIEYKNPYLTTTLYSENKEVKYNLAILVNKNSASASEAFSAAVQDTGVGIVIGEQTFGKGTMQNITRFRIGGGVKLTEAIYLSPNKRSINGKGVEPDVYLPDKTTSYEKSDFIKITYDRKMNIGDSGDDVLALEQRLYYMGYSIGYPDGIYDEQTAAAVKSFQSRTGLYPYGVADITTQLKLEDILRCEQIVNNTTLDKAIEIFKNENWEDCKQDWSVSNENQ